jgi:VanZ family protein
MKITQKQFFAYWLPVLALCVALFVQSSFPSLDLGPSFPFKDKMLHMAAYGLLAALFCRACIATSPNRISPLPLLVISVCFATLYGVSDEFHQAFVSARQADAYDVLADFSGSVLGAGGYIKWNHRFRLNNHSRKKQL